MLRQQTPLALIVFAAATLMTCAPERSSHRACPPTSIPLPAAAEGEAIDQRSLGAWVELLADPARRGRRASTPEAHDVAGLLGGAMDRMHIQSVPGGRCQSYAFMESEDFNVVGHLISSDEAPWVVVGAHYDGRGVHPRGVVFPGADDNASGVAALLEIMRLAQKAPPLPVSIAFVFFGAEEIGLLGVKTWIAEPSIAVDEIELAINLDMVGRRLPDGSQGIGYSFPAPRHRNSLPILEQGAARIGLALVPLDTWHAPGKLFSDSTILAERLPAVPSVLLSTGLHADYHEASDTADRVDTVQITRAVELILEILRGFPTAGSRQVSRR